MDWSAQNPEDNLQKRTKTRVERGIPPFPAEVQVEAASPGPLPFPSALRAGSEVYDEEAALLHKISISSDKSIKLQKTVNRISDGSKAVAALAVAATAEASTVLRQTIGDADSFAKAIPAEAVNESSAVRPLDAETLPERLSKVHCTAILNETRPAGLAASSCEKNADVENESLGIRPMSSAFVRGDNRERSTSIMPANFEDFIPAPLPELDLVELGKRSEDLNAHYDALLVGTRLPTVICRAL